jgi:RNA recognition motif-containing protein
MTRLFVYSLPWSVTSDALLEYLRGEYFAVTTVQVVINRDTQRSRGYAFVEFENEVSAKAALEACVAGKLHMGGRLLKANAAHPKREHVPSLEVK